MNADLQCHSAVLKMIYLVYISHVLGSATLDAYCLDDVFPNLNHKFPNMGFWSTKPYF